MHYIGIDAGGTKTLFVLYSDEGSILDTLTLESCHFMKVGYPRMGEILKEGVLKLLRGTGILKEDVTLSFGLAGYGREEGVRRAIEEVLADTFEGFRIHLHNDIETAIEGAFTGDDGIMLISGTGSISFMKHQGILKRAGGWGYNLGDEGSAYFLAKKMLNVFTKEDDGRLEKTVLYDLLMRELSLKEPYDLISYLGNTLGNRRDEIAKLATILYEAALQGDAEAIRIYEEAGRELASLVNALAKDIGSDVRLALYGGVFNAGDLIMVPLKKHLLKHVSIVVPAYPPEYGAYLLAKTAKK